MKKLQVLLISFFLVGCSNPQNATDANFKDAIQKYFNDTRACFSIDVAFPYEHEKKRNKNVILEELVKLGLLSKEDSIKVSENMFNKKLLTKESAVKYSLKAKGEKVATLIRKNTAFSSGKTKICYGVYKVEDIIDFSEPADMFGQKISKVNYTYKISNVASWAENDVLKMKYATLKKDLNSSQKSERGKVILILTNKGWLHKKQFKKGI